MIDKTLEYLDYSLSSSSSITSSLTPSLPSTLSSLPNSLPSLPSLPSSHELPDANSMEEQKSIRIAPFLKSLLNILDAEDTQVIRWSEDGLSFEIVNIDVMTLQVLPKYFRHKKFASFQRQLNYFGFKKISKRKTTHCTYKRDHFSRDDRHMLHMIRRKTTSEKRQHSLDGDDEFYFECSRIKSQILSNNEIKKTAPSHDDDKKGFPIPCGNKRIVISNDDDKKGFATTCGNKRPFIDTNPLSPQSKRSIARSSTMNSISPVYRASSQKKSLIMDDFQLDLDKCSDLLTTEDEDDETNNEPRRGNEPGAFVNDEEWIEDVDYLTKGGILNSYKKVDDYQTTLDNQLYSDDFLGKWLSHEQDLDFIFNISRCPL